MTIMKLRLGFLVLDASEYVGIYCGLRTQFFYSWKRGEYILIFFNIICLYTKYGKNIRNHTQKTARNFKDLIEKRLFKDIH